MYFKYKILLPWVPDVDADYLRALTMQDSIIESKTINYILFMVFCLCGSIFIEEKKVEKIRLYDRVCIANVLKTKLNVGVKTTSEVEK